MFLLQRSSEMWGVLKEYWNFYLACCESLVSVRICVGAADSVRLCACVPFGRAVFESTPVCVHHVRLCAFCQLHARTRTWGEREIERERWREKLCWVLRAPTERLRTMRYEARRGVYINIYTNNRTRGEWRNGDLRWNRRYTANAEHCGETTANSHGILYTHRSVRFFFCHFFHSNSASLCSLFLFGPSYERFGARARV